MQNIVIVYNKLPPTSNKIYFQGTRLRSEARKYAEDFSYDVVRNHLPEISMLNRNGVFALHLRFYFDALMNKSFLDLDPKKRAESLYKKLDLSNRVKLLEDCIRDALAIDDSQTFAASQEKYQDPGKERVEILVQEIEAAQFGVLSYENALAVREGRATWTRTP
jgi:Holliday junction resolvase RusA-like endonuclease